MLILKITVTFCRHLLFWKTIKVWPHSRWVHLPLLASFTYLPRVVTHRSLVNDLFTVLSIFLLISITAQNQKSLDTFENEAFIGFLKKIKLFRKAMISV